jgi:hypothetical protein
MRTLTRRLDRTSSDHVMCQTMSDHALTGSKMSSQIKPRPLIKAYHGPVPRS